MKIIIIANRLPVHVQKKNGKINVSRSVGGLATGLGSLETKAEKVWVGWPGFHTEDENEKKIVSKRLQKLKYHPVYLTQNHIEKYYEGYSNSTIWPLCHYFYSYIQFKTEYWEAYKEVNRLFCEAVLPHIEDDDIIWVQDYQLMLLPKMIRDKKPNVNIGYFHHIPFPSYELFRVLPDKEEVLEGLLGADLIGFHTHDYMRHFISAIYRVLDLNCNLDEIRLKDRVVHVDAFPMGINYEQYHNASKLPTVVQKAKILKRKMGEQTTILSVDRLDYSKGILHRLEGFAEFLKNHLEFHEKVSLAMIVVPSRDEVQLYADLKMKIEQTIGQINGMYSTIGWTPIYYFYRSFNFNELIAMYLNAEIALVTPLRDGMNLVAKEYLATQRENNAVLILSEMAGAANELTDAIIINPNDKKEIEDALVQALSMSDKEKGERLSQMQKLIARNDVRKWAKDFIQEMISIKSQNESINQKIIDNKQLNDIKHRYDAANSRLIVLDYDGTLAPFVKNPMDAKPSKRLLSLLKKLADDSKNKVIINSGRNREIMDMWFEELDIDFAAEHGAFYKENNKWNQNVIEKYPWNDEIVDIVQHTVDKTPHSTMEIKDTALVWHFRKVDVWLAELREKQIINELMEPCTRQNLQIVRGDKIIEIKSPENNKGNVITRQLEEHNYDFVFAIGDDTTDEDMFRALPENGISIKVGNYSENSLYSLNSQSMVIPFLEKLIK
ncbi:MAG: bifunctional alpha,alpha-trehalose-phosphate synthase (UDP-forming)/trehalose-phosphatase [Dysgonamonadaceae bacterium]|nr:bifunctional alpha,alpha-trehalose-phosphate synthase (UDP-forming)/trehalose-phosphatase [Dysgonamonadaceae bacterium]MDD3309439.1 bifunctional alpha,alpha-trehalose-phosphate synthase (UDP-forming)/trehalose-phosphatase [Dysgonamonadaceae bacterium]MDD3899778.1 bifunctional alpha,alpha-trehalose-phosphate synthase (UDP-forming)/trehalose-phosphatase [Dysgonamonadaceae bacterium]MDD4399812.1 bifunctional alpha,alpha-trehalose-phosphate synthase (UDP-forming)/trehalose-phosphatase [Dysgonamon